MYFAALHTKTESGHCEAVAELRRRARRSRRAAGRSLRRLAREHFLGGAAGTELHEAATATGTRAPRQAMSIDSIPDPAGG